MTTVSDLGLVYIWTNPVVERWAAYAPGFEELEENAEYIEKEDEFDVVDAKELDRRKQDEQNQYVDILGSDGVESSTEAFLPSDAKEAVDEDPEDNEDDFYPLQDVDTFAITLDNAEEVAALSQSGDVDSLDVEHMPRGATYTSRTGSNSRDRSESVKPQKFESLRSSKADMGLRDKSERRQSALKQQQVQDEMLLAKALAEIAEEDKRPKRQRH